MNGKKNIINRVKRATKNLYILFFSVPLDVGINYKWGVAAAAARPPLRARGKSPRTPAFSSRYNRTSSVVLFSPSTLPPRKKKESSSL